MSALIALLILILAIIYFKKIIGIALMIGVIGYGIYLFKDKDKFSKFAKATKILLVIVMVVVFSIGKSLAFPTEKPIDTSIDDHTMKNKQEVSSETNNSTAPIVSTANTRMQENDTKDVKEDVDQEIKFETATVTKHVDGDTVYVKLEDGEEYKLRFIGVNTPETVYPSKPVEFYGKEASDFTESKLLGQTVYLEKDVSETDKYNRLLRYIWLEKPTEINKDEIKSKMFNAILVANGYAQVSTFPPDVKYQDYFLDLEKEARNKDIGLWAKPDEEETAQTTSTTSSSSDTSNSSSQSNRFEDKSEPDETYDYMGNSNSMKFHYTSCGSAKKTSEGNRVYFKTRDEAINKGYVPCKRCNP